MVYKPTNGVTVGQESHVSGSRLRERLEKAVFAAIDDVNELLPSALAKKTDTVLFGTLDSLGFVNLTVALEDQLEKEFGLRMSLSGQLEAGALNWESWRTIGNLIEHITPLVERETK